MQVRKLAAMLTLLAMVAALMPLTASVALAGGQGNGNPCPAEFTKVDPPKDKTFEWGSADVRNGYVEFTVKDGWEVKVCVKGGPDYNTETIEGPDTEKVYTPKLKKGNRPGVSHYGYKVKKRPDPKPEKVTVEVIGFCEVGDQGVAQGVAAIEIDPDNAATVTFNGEDYTTDDKVSVDAPGSYKWSAKAHKGFKIEGDSEGTVYIEDCSVERPGPDVKYSEWVDGGWVCDDTTVTQTRTKTVTPYKWDVQTESWILDPENAVVTVEEQERDLTEDEQFACPRCLDINTATLDELIQVNGLDATLAQAVIDGRPYESIDHMVEVVKGIGPVSVLPMMEPDSETGAFISDDCLTVEKPPTTPTTEPTTPTTEPTTPTTEPTTPTTEPEPENPFANIDYWCDVDGLNLYLSEGEWQIAGYLDGERLWDHTFSVTEVNELGYAGFGIALGGADEFVVHTDGLSQTFALDDCPIEPTEEPEEAEDETPSTLPFTGPSDHTGVLAGAGLLALIAGAGLTFLARKGEEDMA